MSKARNRINPMRVYVNAEEREAIRSNARSAGLTTSGFLRAAAVGSTPRSTLDHRAVALLAKLHADEGRLGGLLKMYLHDRDPDRLTAERLLRDIESLRGEIRTVLRQVVP